MIRRLPLLSLLLLAACPEQIGSQCPAHTVAVGQYTLNFAGQHPADECKATPADAGDGGGAPTPLTFDDGGARGATFCFGSASDGGPQLSLIIPGKGLRTSDLLADGGFHFTGHSDPVPGTACGCAVAIDETFDGFLLSGDAGAAVQGDGGLPPITSVAGSLTDVLSTDAGADAGCLCTLPCPVTYSISGSRF